MKSLFSKLFLYSVIQEAEELPQNGMPTADSTAQQNPMAPAAPNSQPAPEKQEDTTPIAGLISPYSAPKKDMTALTIASMNDDSALRFALIRAHQKCSRSIQSAKKMDPGGFDSFKQRLLDTFVLNDILTDDPAIQENTADYFTWAYASINKKEKLLVFRNKDAAKKEAAAIFSNAVHRGLELRSETRAASIFLDALITTLYIPKEK